MDSNSIITLFNTVGIIVGAYLVYKDKKNTLDFQKEQAKKDTELKKEIADKAIAQNDKMERKFDIVVEKQQTLETEFSKLDQKIDAKFNQLNITLKEHISNSEVKESFVSSIYRATEGEAIRTIQNNFTIDTDVKSIIIK